MFKDLKDIGNLKINLLDTLSLAFVGDAIHSLYVRTMLVASKDYKQKDLQSITSKIVCATNQSKTISSLESMLTQEELSIVKRARNAHNNNKAKNSTASDYKKSTSYEALIGYLYYKDEIERMNEFLKKSVDIAIDKK